MRRLLIVWLCALCGVAVCGGAMAQFARSEDAIRYRQSVMFLIGQHFGRIAAVVQGREDFDRERLEHNANLLVTLSHLPWDAFKVPGTDRGTRLRAAAFTDVEGFQKAAQNSMADVTGLAQAAASGDLDAVRTRFGAAGQSCKACHDQYR